MSLCGRDLFARPFGPACLTKLSVQRSPITLRLELLACRHRPAQLHPLPLAFAAPPLLPFDTRLKIVEPDRGDCFLPYHRIGPSSIVNSDSMTRFSLQFVGPCLCVHLILFPRLNTGISLSALACSRAGAPNSASP